MMAALGGLGAGGAGGGILSGLLGSLLGGSSKGGTPASESGAGAGRRGGNTAVGTTQAQTLASSNPSGGILGGSSGIMGLSDRIGDSLNQNKLRKSSQVFMPNSSPPNIQFQGPGYSGGGLGGLMLARILGLGG